MSKKVDDNSVSPSGGKNGKKDRCKNTDKHHHKPVEKPIAIVPVQQTEILPQILPRRKDLRTAKKKGESNHHRQTRSRKKVLQVPEVYLISQI